MMHSLIFIFLVHVNLLFHIYCKWSANCDVFVKWPKGSGTTLVWSIPLLAIFYVSGL